MTPDSPVTIRTPLHRLCGKVLPTHALLVFAILSAVIIAVATALILWHLRVREVARVEREIDNLSLALAEQTARAVQSVDLILRSTQERLHEGNASGFLIDEAAVHTLLRARIDGVPYVRAVSVIGADGLLQRSSRALPVPTLSLAERDFFLVHRDHADRGLYIDKPAYDRLAEARTIQLSRRFTGANGAFEGVITAAVDPAYFEELYRSLSLGAGSSVSLFLRDGTLVARSPHVDGAVADTLVEGTLFRTLNAQSATAKARQPLASEHTLLAYCEVRDFPLVVAVAVDRESAVADWSNASMLIAGGAAAVVVLLALAAYSLARELAREERLTQALTDSEARLNGIIHSAMDAIVTIDEAQRIVLFNPAAEKMFGCPVADAMGTQLERFIPAVYREAHARHVQCFGETGLTSRAMGEHPDIIALRADGEEFPIDVSISQVHAGGKRLYTAIVRNISRRRQAEDALRQSNAQLRELSASLQSVREEERTRIARELHDELGQQLTSLKMDLAWFATKVSDSRLQDRLGAMTQVVDATVASTRRLSSELRPLMLDDLGLIPAVEWLAQDFSRRTGIAIDMDLPAEDDTLPEEIKTPLFRILQESLTNVARHAQASRVCITLAHHDDTVRLTVRDNGNGLAPDAQRKRGSYGLMGIRERVYLLGGNVCISGEAGAGTTVEVSVPLGEESALAPE